MGSETRVSRWGGSLAVRIPGRVAENGGVREGAVVEPEIRNEEVILRKRRYELNSLWTKSRGVRAEMHPG